MTNGPVVGVVGTDTDGVVAAVEAAGGTPVVGAARSVVDDSEALIAVGEPALLAVARAAPSVSVLPVAAGRGVRSVPLDAVGEAVDAYLSDDFERSSHPIVDVRVGDGTRARALLDVMLVSAEPAQISEYAVDSGDLRVARFRADGVVLATPAGSSGYASAAGGPVLSPDADAAAVVPVAPFETDTDHWVVPTDDLSVSVERDETAVHLLADDRVVGTVDPDESVSATPGASLSVAVVDESRSPYASA
ncbi:ATP-NAD kinase [Halosimplex aquaticum]|uniref:ATP-NAD kinase n=1 Tax=Halosimplex aquaticum TaxID=3026162 RepID=A0ABD5Y4Q1_9EURY|nr:ATP-NAD kinase [Halosimplex aquaticum]